jgi:hypothetical protein
MLFEFNDLWKRLLIVILAWASYVLLGFEFTSITLLAILASLYYIK